jgi:urate oxidase
MTQLIRQSYGKHRVRFSKIKRSSGVLDQVGGTGDRHDFFEASVDVELEGDFESAYTQGDNRLVVATDTCRNTIYVLAKDHPIDSLESFGVAVASHFLNQYDHVSRVSVALEQQLWHRMNDSSHGFMGTDRETPTAQIVATRSPEGGHLIELSSGIKNFMIAKTTQSGFSDFHRDEFRTLPDVDDRILATAMTASWACRLSDAIDFVAVRQIVRTQMLAAFLDHYSRSVQETLYRMATAALESCDALESITLTMPNKHHIRFNLEPFGRSNENEVFIVTDEPFGYITATVGR